jgi:hypothetical protein
VKSLLLALTTPWLALGCLSPDQFSRPMDSMQLLADDEAMTQEVLRYISLGMPLNSAKIIMEQNDFRCSYRNCSPGERHYLSCKGTISQTSTGSAFLRSAGCATIVEVRLFYEGGVVTDVQVRHYVDGQ